MLRGKHRMEDHTQSRGIVKVNLYSNRSACNLHLQSPLVGVHPHRIKQVLVLLSLPRPASHHLLLRSRNPSRLWYRPPRRDSPNRPWGSLRNVRSPSWGTEPDGNVTTASTVSLWPTLDLKGRGQSLRVNRPNSSRKKKDPGTETRNPNSLLRSHRQTGRNLGPRSTGQG